MDRVSSSASPLANEYPKLGRTETLAILDLIDQLIYIMRVINKKRNATPGPGTANRILDAAERVFAREGFFGASTRAIATAANANIGLLNYYFGSKEGLLDAVLARRVDSLLENINQSINSNADPDQAVQIFLRESATYLASESPPFLIVAVKESLGSEPTPIAEMVMARLRPHRELIARILEAGIRNGTFHPIDSTVFYAMAMGALATTGGWPALHAAGAAGPAIDVLLRGIRREPKAPAPQHTESEPGNYEPEPPVTVDEDPFEIGMID